jgi:glyoxylase-like metal-dependent hydrolase (beta-lactamase superfamily II)
VLPVNAQLVGLKGDTCIIPGQVNVGVVVRGRECLLVDTGADGDAGERIFSCLESEGLRPLAIINTHPHPGHCGANITFSRKAGTKIFASHDGNAAITAIPAEGVVSPGSFSIGCFNVEIIALPGHTAAQIGVVTKDNVCFTGDAYFPQFILDRYGFPVVDDISATMRTLRKLWLSHHDLYVPGHSEPTAKAADIVLKNVALIEMFLDKILRILQEKDCTDEELLSALMDRGELVLNPVQFGEFSAAVEVYLSYLCGLQKIERDSLGSKKVWKFCASDG